MIPVLLKDILPGEHLTGYVRKYQVFRFIFDKAVIPPIKFHPPRPEHCITFYVKDVQKFSYLNSAIQSSYPQCVINGIYTVPVYRYGGNDFLAIKVVLQPSVLHQLLRFPLNELTNKFIDAEDVWGAEVRSLCERLNESDDLSQMMQFVETFIEKQIKKTKKYAHPMDEVPEYMLNINKDASINWLANQSCLSVRQFIRKFEERIGISAKMFERVIRFDKAYRMKNSALENDWLSIAIACGYHDYQHMAKEFKEFTNLTPPALFELEKKAPERSFGLFYNS
jgi:AraC-like DNA-binding protein